jgi:hypothetical protein
VTNRSGGNDQRGNVKSTLQKYMHRSICLYASRLDIFLSVTLIGYNSGTVIDTITVPGAEVRLRLANKTGQSKVTWPEWLGHFGSRLDFEIFAFPIDFYGKTMSGQPGQLVGHIKNPTRAKVLGYRPLTN